MADFRHWALHHHGEGIFLAEQLFGVTVTLSTGRAVPVRLIGEQHVLEDIGHIPSFVDWVRAVRPEPWMGPTPSIPDGDGLPLHHLPGTELPDLQSDFEGTTP